MRTCMSSAETQLLLKMHITTKKHAQTQNTPRRCYPTMRVLKSCDGGREVGWMDSRPKHGRNMRLEIYTHVRNNGVKTKSQKLMKFSVLVQCKNSHFCLRIIT